MGAMRLKTIGVGVVLGLLLVGNGTAQTSAFSAAPQTVLDSLRAADGFPGAMAAVAGPEQVATAATGQADTEQGTPMAPDTRMLSGSTSKSFAAAVALHLAQAGQLELDAPIDRWLGGRSCTAAGRPATCRSSSTTPTTVLP